MDGKQSYAIWYEQVRLLEEEIEHLQQQLDVNENEVYDEAGRNLRRGLRNRGHR